MSAHSILRLCKKSEGLKYYDLVIPNNVDNIMGFKGISYLLACKYNDLYNCVSNTVSDCSSTMKKINTKAYRTICSEDYSHDKLVQC